MGNPDPAEPSPPTQAKNARFEPQRSFACPPLRTACFGTPQESHAMAATAFTLTPPATYPALPLDRLMAWQRQVFANTNLRPSRKLVAAALATYHNSQT